MFRRVAIAVAAAAITACPALAAHAPGDIAAAIQAARPASATSDQLDARLGPKYVTFRTPSGTGIAAAAAAHGRSGRSFPYRDMLIPIAAVLIALVGIAARRHLAQRSAAGRVAIDA